MDGQDPRRQRKPTSLMAVQLGKQEATGLPSPYLPSLAPPTGSSPASSWNDHAVSTVVAADMRVRDETHDSGLAPGYYPQQIAGLIPNELSDLQAQQGLSGWHLDDPESSNHLLFGEVFDSYDFTDFTQGSTSHSHLAGSATNTLRSTTSTDDSSQRTEWVNFCNSNPSSLQTQLVPFPTSLSPQITNYANQSTGITPPDDYTTCP
ncbi:hypothetical protein FOVSG1_015465 [Fusarium oxysporum f. sp. vasinfectum]